QGVADQMIERGLQTVQDVAIDARGLAHDLELHFLAKLARDVADQARKTADPIGQGTHPACQHFVVQPAREILAAASELLERLERLTQSFQAARGLSSDRGEELALCGRQRFASARQAIFEPLERFQESGLTAL